MTRRGFGMRRVVLTLVGVLTAAFGNSGAAADATDTRRPLFAVVAYDETTPTQETLAQLEKLGPGHVPYVKAHDGMLRIAMALLDEQGRHRGTFYLFEADTQKQVQEWLAREPLYVAGQYRQVHVFPILLGLNTLTPMPWFWTDGFAHPVALPGMTVNVGDKDAHYAR